MDEMRALAHIKALVLVLDNVSKERVATLKELTKRSESAQFSGIATKRKRMRERDTLFRHELQPTDILLFIERW